MLGCALVSRHGNLRLQLRGIFGPLRLVFQLVGHGMEFVPENFQFCVPRIAAQPLRQGSQLQYFVLITSHEMITPLPGARSGRTKRLQPDGNQDGLKLGKCALFQPCRS